LAGASRSILDVALNRIRQNRFQEVPAALDDLQKITKWSSPVYERAEAFLECGIAYNQIGNNQLAVELLRKAVLDFAPNRGDSHKQTMARWILGAVEWMISTEKNQAIIEWTKCIEELAELGLRATRRNRQNRKRWYADRRAILQAALSAQISASDSLRMRSIRRG
jgi:tetratricopeptide (TPR) repeat protein